MEWEHVAFLQWRARGKDGEFTVWKDGQKWKGKYRSANGLYTCIFKEQKSLKAIKEVCESSNHWE